jgi:hypothetical protein
MRSETLTNILTSITPEEEQEWKQKRIDRKNKLTVDYQLGYYVGKYIIFGSLPTLSTYTFQTHRVIQVSEEDSVENNRLNNEWFESTEFMGGKEENGDKEKWDLFYQHNKMLDEKYLPNPLVCYLDPLNIQNMDEFKKGLQSALWDCDVCAYNIEPENIKIYDHEEGYSTIIEFKL